MGFRVISIGSWDILHKDHLRLFRECKRLAGEGGHLTVAVNTSEFIMRCKGRLPYYDYGTRVNGLKQIEDIDEVMPNLAGEDIKPTLLKAKPDILAVGSDWHHPKDYLKQLNVDFKWLAQRNIFLVYVPSLERVHSTDIRKTLWKA